MSNNPEKPRSGNFVSRWLNEKKSLKLAQAQAEVHLASETAAQPAREKKATEYIEKISLIWSEMYTEEFDAGNLGKINSVQSFSGHNFNISFQSADGTWRSFYYSSEKKLRFGSYDNSPMIQSTAIDQLELLSALTTNVSLLSNIVRQQGREKQKRFLVEDYSNVLKHADREAFVFEGKIEEEQFRLTKGKIDENAHLIVVQCNNNATYILKVEKSAKSIQKVIIPSNDHYNPHDSEKYIHIELKKNDADYLGQVIQALPQVQPTGWGRLEDYHIANYGVWMSEEQINQINSETSEKHVHIIFVNEEIKRETVQRATYRKITEIPKNNETRRGIIRVNEPTQEYKQVKIEIPWENLWKEVGTYYREDAHAIMEMITKGVGVIVNAPCGAGKSKLLSPAIKRLAKKQGFIVGEKAGPDFHTTTLFEEHQYSHTFGIIITDVFPHASSEQKKLFILDEVACMGIENLGDTEALFRYLKDHNISFVLLNSAPQEKMRVKSASGMIDIASKVGLPLAIHEQKQRGHIPIEIVNKYLKSESIEPALLDFLTHAENDAFRSLRLFSMYLIPAIVKESAMGIAPIRTLAQLRSYADKNHEIWMRQMLGESKITLVRALTNLGVINANHQWSIDTIKNYD